MGYMPRQLEQAEEEPRGGWGRNRVIIVKPGRLPGFLAYGVEYKMNIFLKLKTIREIL